MIELPRKNTATISLPSFPSATPIKAFRLEQFQKKQKGPSLTPPP